MTAPSVDYGQAQIAAFNEAAGAGKIKFDAQAVAEAVALYNQMIDGLNRVRDNLGHVRDAKGFGGFISGHELQKGFSDKAVEGIDVIGQLIDGAMRLQEAYLRAGGLIVEADQMNASRIKLLESPLQTGSPTE